MKLQLFLSISLLATLAHAATVSVINTPNFGGTGIYNADNNWATSTDTSTLNTWAANGTTGWIVETVAGATQGYAYNQGSPSDAGLAYVNTNVKSLSISSSGDIVFSFDWIATGASTVSYDIVGWSLASSTPNPSDGNSSGKAFLKLDNITGDEYLNMGAQALAVEFLNGTQYTTTNYTSTAKQTVTATGASSGTQAITISSSTYNYDLSTLDAIGIRFHTDSSDMHINNVSLAVTPEPSSLALLLIGLSSLTFMRRRKNIA